MRLEPQKLHKYKEKEGEEEQEEKKGNRSLPRRGVAFEAKAFEEGCILSKGIGWGRASGWRKGNIGVLGLKPGIWPAALRA